MGLSRRGRVPPFIACRIVNASRLEDLLTRLRAGEIDVATASQQILEALRSAPIEDLGFARIDVHRELRQGFPEVILGIGKTPGQIASIAERIVARGQPLLVTRASDAAFDAVKAVVPDARYHEHARAITLTQGSIAAGRGTVIVACAGTSDLPVAEEAVVTAELMGNVVERMYDVGVAGIHRVLANRKSLTQARVIIVCAGM